MGSHSVHVDEGMDVNNEGVPIGTSAQIDDILTLLLYVFQDCSFCWFHRGGGLLRVYSCSDVIANRFWKEEDRKDRGA